MSRLKLILLISLTGICLGTFAQNAQRIVSLAPSLTNMLYLLDAGDRMVGCTSYCTEAVQDNKEIVASAVEVNVEKVLLLKPDWVVATTITKPTVIESMRKMGLNVLVLSSPKSYNDICTQLLTLAKPVGKEFMAQNIITKQQERLNALAKKIPSGQKPRVFFEIGAQPLFTVIPNTFMDDFITFAGGENIASDLTRGTITRENVLLKNPDVIVVVTMGIVGDEEKTTWEGYSNLSAAKTGKIFIVDSDKACSPNPVTFVDVVEELINLIYK